MPKNNPNYLSDAKSVVDKNRADIKKDLQDDRDALLMGFGEDAVKALTPFMKELAQTGKYNKDELKEMINGIKVQANINVPEVKVPKAEVNVNFPDIDASKIKIPEIKVPKAQVDVRVPEIKVPDIIMPKQMDIKGFVGLHGVNMENPLPVQIRDSNGKPVSFGGNTVVSGGGGGGKADFFTIKDIRASTVSLIDQDTGTLKVSMSSSASGGLTDAELRATPVPMSVSSQFGTTYTTDDMVNSDNRLRVSLETGGSGLTDAELRASSVPVAQASGANYSVNVTNTVLTRPVNVRGSMQTAYVEASSEGEKTLLAGVGATYHDLVYLMCANSSDAAITIDIRQTTGGTVQSTIEVPANGTAGVATPVPIPQDHADATWTVDNNSADNSNTTYAVTALFSKEP